MAGASRTPARGRLAGAPIGSAPAIKIGASKSKEIQAKKLAFPWIPLVESGLFNGLQRIQTKKMFRAFTKLRRTTRFSFVAPLSAPDHREQENYSTDSDFRKGNVRAKLRALVDVPGQRIPYGWHWWPGRGDGIRTQAAAAPDRAGPVSWAGSSRAGHKVAAVKLREFFARCALTSIHLN
jgi:hypothetical protein